MTIKHKIKSWLLLSPLIIFIIVYLIHPLISIIGDSVKITSIIDRVNYHLGVANFQNVINSPTFQIAFNNSTYLLVIGVICSIGLSLLLALALNGIMNWLFRHVVVLIWFSQFFISAFAVGVAFIYLFDGNYNAFNGIFHTNINWDHHGLLILLIFHVWRMLGFNSVILLFHFHQQKVKYYKLGKIDHLSIRDWCYYVYFQKMKPVMWLLVYVNVFQALFLNPVAIFNMNTIVNNQIYTLAYYVYYNLKIISAPQFAYVSAASILILSYLVGLMLLLFGGYWLSAKGWHYYQKIRTQNENLRAHC